DPTIGRLALGLPGIILLLYFWIGFTSIRYMLMIVGGYLILKGFGIEDWAINGTKNFIRTISFQRLSFPFYIATIVFAVFLGIAFYGNYVNEAGSGVVPQLAKTAQRSIGFLALAGATFVLGKIVDAHYLYKAFKLRTYTIIFGSIFIMWYILDSGLGVILGQYTLGDLLITVVLSAAAFIVTMQVTKIFESKIHIGKSLLGQEVYNTKGQRIGEVTKVEKKRNAIFVKPNKGRGYIITQSNLNQRADGLVKLA
ncbi:MAG: DUF373 family protein, partial [Candidatus Diapherotrites archaeon]|nr:DUF373 family protein [Candidatus Diapherotrites archaeon]